MEKIKEEISKYYPSTFKTLTYENYKEKFHILLFMEEIEVNIKLYFNKL